MSTIVLIILIASGVAIILTTTLCLVFLLPKDSDLDNSEIIQSTSLISSSDSIQSTILLESDFQSYSDQPTTLTSNFNSESESESNSQSQLITDKQTEEETVLTTEKLTEKVTTVVTEKEAESPTCLVPDPLSPYKTSIVNEDSEPIPGLETAEVPSFIHGVDISWCTEMEDDGMNFYDSNNNTIDIFQLMKNIGIEAVRLRVWVNPETKYGPYNNKEDTLKKAKRAKDAGLLVMIDFHYSDYFADPGKQVKPVAWAGLDYYGVKQKVYEHTKDVLLALKKEGVQVIWVQVGNESTGGMIHDDGRLEWLAPNIDQCWQNYAELSNAGYDAVKEVYPDAKVIVHHDNGHHDNIWFYERFQNAGGKFDMIGLSYYPDWSEWGSEILVAAQRVKELYERFNIPVMIVETGFSTWDQTKASGEEQTGDSHYAEQVFTLLFEKMREQPGCSGIFYWEPDVYGGFSHQITEDGIDIKESGTYGKLVTNHGALNMYGQPSIQLILFAKL